MSERNLNSKRESRELQASSTSVSPLQKKKKLDDSSADSHAVVLAILSFRSFNASSESNETVRNNPSSGVDLEDTVSEALGETTETEMESSSPALKRDNKPPGVSKIPTAEEVEAFLSELEGGEDKQKRFIEK
ncbi:hypothetical protein Bca52824_025967 [Brassica carinata]|uniref:Uncharacterized protein n=1 Tax=Brassica carinata TaxID=52824 RepID=A0A8X7SKQ0_BRACI|nr:hypothetical protein Bca52824_025967 [Brassica carinata]